MKTEFSETVKIAKKWKKEPLISKMNDKKANGSRPKENKTLHVRVHVRLGICMCAYMQSCAFAYGFTKERAKGIKETEADNMIGCSL